MDSRFRGNDELDRVIIVSSPYRPGLGAMSTPPSNVLAKHEVMDFFEAALTIE